MTWFETIRLRLARAREAQLRPERLRQFRRRAENVALRIREVLLRGDSITQEAAEQATNIGKSIFLKGQLVGHEDLIIEGRVEGKIELEDHNLVVGPHGKINAQINAKNVIVMGKVVGNIYATKMVEIKSPGSVVGDINSSRISVEDGARFKGSVDIQGRVDITEQLNSSKAGPAPIPSQPSGKIP